MMRRLIREFSISLLLCAAVLAVFPDHLIAATLVPKVRIVATEGDVAVKYKGTGDFVSVWRYDRVGPGDAIATGPASGAELVFGDGSLIRMGAGATLTLEAIEPSRAAGEARTGDRIVVTVRARLEGSRARVAVGEGSQITLSTGFVSIATDRATGADFILAADVFSMGYYLRVERGCVFLFLRDSRVVPVCGRSRMIVRMFADEVIPLLSPDPSTDNIALGFSEEPPTILAREEAVRDITIDGAGDVRCTDTIFYISTGGMGGQGPLALRGAVDPGWVVLVSADDGADWATVTPDETGRWDYLIERPPVGGLSLLVKSAFIGPIPEGLETLAAAPPEAPSSPGTTPPTPEGSSDEIAARFVQEFTGALERKDTSALSWLISADYSGVVGGSSRSAFLRAAGDYFRSGGTISVSATAGGALRSGEGVIVTMAFAARSDTTTKAGSIKLWLSPEGTLTHAEGEWIF